MTRRDYDYSAQRAPGRVFENSFSCGSIVLVEVRATPDGFTYRCYRVSCRRPATVTSAPALAWALATSFPMSRAGGTDDEYNFATIC